MPDPPEEPEKASKQEYVELLRAESRALALALDEERRRFDRQVRLAGLALTAVSIGLATLAPLSGRGAIVCGAGLVGGPLAVLLGGQGATRPETLPGWTQAAYAGGATIGMALAFLLLR